MSLHSTLTPQEVAALLLARGSLPISHLVRLSTLPPSLIFSSLVVLSLHSLLYHSESDVQGRLTELYELNPSAVENRLRGSLYSHLCEGLVSRGMGGLDFAVETLWKEGMMPAQVLAKEVAKVKWAEEEARLAAEAAGESSSSFEADAGVNGKGKGKGKEVVGAGGGGTEPRPTSRIQAERNALTMISRAVRDGFLSIITPGSQLSPSSLEIKWEEELRLEIKGVPTAKDLREVKDRLRDKKAQWAEEERERAQGKQPGADSIKKKKRSGEGDAEYLVPLPRHAFYRINTERFHIRWRSLLIMDYARALYNPAVSAVLSVILNLVEDDVDTMSDPTSRSFTSNEVISKIGQMNPSPILSPCFAPPPIDKKHPAIPTPKRTHDLVLEICKVLERADDSGADLSRAFLAPVGGRDGATSKWVVNWGPLGAGMKRALVESLIRDKLDQRALLCWRILDARGKLDEKHLARLAFLPIKEAREVIGQLSSSGFIEQQEIPRSADRAPGRTIFLWHVSYDKVIASLVQHHAKALANIQAQKAFQLSKRAGLVAKRERSDVRADPEKLLTRRDVEGLEELDKVLEALTVAEMRIDKDVFVLRELDPVDW